jgi:hypothetical protein
MSDSGANVVIMRDEELLDAKQLTRVLKNIKIRGVRDGSFVCEAMGYLKSPFENLFGMYVPMFKANIIGEVAARKAGYGILQENTKRFEEDDLKYLNDKGEIIATFTRGKENLWCYKRDEEICLVSLESSILNRDIEIANQSTGDVKTVLNNMMKKGYNSQQITQMFRVHELHKRMDYISGHKLQRIVTGNLVKNIDRICGKITEKSILAYFRDMHQEICTGCTGKIVAERSPPIDAVHAVHEAVKAHGDIFYITAARLGLPNLKGNFLFFIDEKTRIFIVFPIPNDKEEEVKKAVNMLVAFYKKYNKTLQIIRFDNAKLFQESSKFNTYLQSIGVSVEPCDPDRHVRLVESANGYLKRTFKCVCAGLPYKLPPKLYKYAILDAAHKINMSPNSSNGWLSPWQLFTGEMPDAVIELRFNFGELVKVFRKSKFGAATDENVERDSIVLGKREASRSGAMILYDIEKDAVFASHQIRKHPGGDETKKQLYKRTEMCANGDKYVRLDEEEIEDYDEFDTLEKRSWEEVQQPKAGSLHKPLASEGADVLTPKTIEESRFSGEGPDAMKTTSAMSSNQDYHGATEGLQSWDGDSERMIIDKARGLSQPRPSEVPSTLEQRATGDSQTVFESLEEMKMASAPCERSPPEELTTGSLAASNHNLRVMEEEILLTDKSYTSFISDVISNSYSNSNQYYNSNSTSSGGVSSSDEDWKSRFNIPTPKSVLDEHLIMEKMLFILRAEEGSLEEEMCKLTDICEIFSAISVSEREYGIDETKKGILEEILQLIETKTWRFIKQDEWKELKRKSGYKQVLPSTLVLKAKYDAENLFIKVKARLVVLGNLQKYVHDVFNKAVLHLLMEKKNGRKNGRFFKITSLNLFFSSIFFLLPFFFTKKKVEVPFFLENQKMEEWKSF